MGTGGRTSPSTPTRARLGRRSAPPGAPGRPWCVAGAGCPSSSRREVGCRSGARLVPSPGREMARAAQSGRAAVQVVDRVVEVDRPIPVIEQVLVSPHGRAWPQALAELDARQPV
jgi:hypothetical protein